jgi:nucleotide-binding universal stress UspA family protein
LYNKILVPLDGSNLSECSLEHVKEIAAGCHVSEVILLAAVEPARNRVVWPSNETQAKESAAQIVEDQKELHRKAESYLSGIAENLKKAGIAAQGAAIDEMENEQAADIILNYARNNNIDLIIMSTHGRSGVSRWAMGSVVEKIVRYSPVPVMTITPTECRLKN